MNIKKQLLTLLSLVIATTSMAGTKSLVSFNDDWHFFKGRVDGAEQVSYDDSQWRKLDLPHDWAIEGPFSVEYNARCGGLPYHGTGWYRKEFYVKPSDEGRVINIVFDAAMNNSTVWVNGVEVGHRPFGYVGFRYDISKYLKYGENNTIAVRLTPEDYSSRWYPGAGLYRNVWMCVDFPTHIPQNGTYITTPTVTDKNAVVQVETDIENSSSSDQTITINYAITSPDNKVVAKKSEEVFVKANSSTKAGIWMDVKSPKRWDAENPNLYTLSTKVLSRDTPIDESETQFGIRTITYDPDGIYINGEKVRFQGVCLHHDNGPLGGALNVRADERKLQIMKEMGANAIRTSHNPPSPEFMALCDKLGFYVLVETFDMWRVQKTPQDYSQYFDQWAETDLRDIVLIHRNHPSAIMWSIGNEILDQRLEDGWKTAKMLNDVCHKYDPTRPTTIGFHNYPQPYIYNMVQQVDIVGANYKPYEYKKIREDYPQLTLYASETSSGVSSRGVYFQPAGLSVANETLQVSSYDYGGARVPRPMDLEMWAQDENPFVMGQFIWTGFDYLGEPTPYGGRDHSTNGYWNGSWPSHASYFGAVDMVGLPKDRFYFYQSQWTKEPMVHLLPHWNWSSMEGEEIPVIVYTNCEEAELFLNGKSLGKKVMGRDIVEFEYFNTSTKKMETMKSKYRLRWEVPYKAGSIKVVGYNNGVAASEKEIKTASKPYAIKLSADRKEITADGKDISYVTIRVEDKDGNLCPMADNDITFNVEGAGELLAVGNGNSASLESFQASHIKAFSGMCVAIVKGDEVKTGTIQVSAKSRGLKSDNITITSTK